MATIQILTKDGVTRRFNTVVSALGESDPIVIDSLKNISVMVLPAAGGATIYTTTDTEARILADTARWIAWDAGAVSVPTVKLLEEAIAIKMANGDGASTAELILTTRFI